MLRNHRSKYFVYLQVYSGNGIYNDGKPFTGINL